MLLIPFLDVSQIPDDRDRIRNGEDPRYIIAGSISRVTRYMARIKLANEVYADNPTACAAWKRVAIEQRATAAASKAYAEALHA